VTSFLSKKFINEFVVQLCSLYPPYFLTFLFHSYLFPDLSLLSHSIMATDRILDPDFQPTVRDCNITLPQQLTLCSLITLANCPDSFNTENHFLVGLLLHIKGAQNDTSFPLNAASSAARYRRGNNIYEGFKKQKTSANFRRMFFFLDLLSKGTCFVIFEKQKQDEVAYWQDINARGNVRVGDILLITEPNPIQHSISGSLSVVTTNGAFVPIEIPANMRPYLSPIVESDKFEGFFLRNIDIVLSNIHCVETSCNGSFCDRLFPASLPCGCYQNNSVRGYRANHVLKYNVTFDTGISGYDEVTIPCSSLRITELLFSKPIPGNITKSQIIPKYEIIRSSLRAIINFVNNNGGWSVSGWLRPTTVTEVGTTTQVLSDTFGFHISYLYPTTNGIAETNEFMGFRVDPNVLFSS
jgi:hypothetical protein